MKENCKRGISLLLSVCLVLGIFASSGLNLVRAADAEPTVETVVSKPNLIANGTFAEARLVKTYTNRVLPSNWESTNLTSAGDDAVIEVTDAYAKTGDLSLHITGTFAKTFNLCSNYTFAADGSDIGKTLVISTWIRGTVAARGARVAVEFRDSNNKAIADTAVTNVPAVGAYDDWTEFKVEATIPEGAVTARVKAIECVASTDADIYLDDVSFIINGGANRFNNTSFETMPAGTECVEESKLFLNAAGWTPGGAAYGTVSVVADPADANNGVLKIEDTSDNYPTVYYGGFPVEVGASYTFTMKYMFADAADAQTLSINLRGNDPSSKGISLVDKATTLKAVEEWQELTITTNAIPEDVSTFYVMLNTSKAAAGIVYIDDVTLTKDCEHTWGKAVVTGKGTCVSPKVSVKTCTACDAEETTTTTYPHSFVKGACSVCGTACEHDAPAGYCLICGLELPAEIIEKELFNNGSFEIGGGNVTTYPVSENWQIAPWTFGGSPKEEGISVGISNEWASDGEWSLLLEDYAETETGAVSYNFFIDVEPGIEKEIYLSADIFTEGKEASWGSVSVIPLVNGVQPKDENGAILTAYKTRATGNFKNFAGENLGVEMTSSSDPIIPADVDQLQVKITTTKGGNSATGEDTTRIFVDNLFLSIDGGDNVLANASFEILPVGSTPVTAPGGDPVIAYPTSKTGVDGWAGLGDLSTALVEAGCVEEITWEDKTKTNAYLHLNDASENGTFTVNYYLYGLEKNTVYTLKFDAKQAGSSNPQINVVQLDGSTIVGTNPLLKEYVDKGAWTEFEYTFTTENVDFTRVRIMFAASRSAIAELWVDNISLTKDCAHNWGEALVTNEDCIHAGQRIVDCADCGAVGVTELNPCTGNHTLVGATCTIPSYCTVPGCGYIAAEALGHDYTGELDGICNRCDNVCGHTYVDEEGNSTNGVCFLCGKGCEHTYAEEAVITEATCTDTGVKTIYCPDCGYSATEEIAALGHDFIDNICQVCGACCTHEFGETVSITLPTYTAMGEKVGICAVCGEQVVETIPAKFYGTSVNLGNTLDMYFGFYTGLVDEGGKVVFVREFADGTTETTEAPITSFKKNNSVYDITYTGLAAKEMCDTIHISVYNSEGTLVGEHSDSIRSYILRQLREKEYGQEFRTLCIDLLNYGAAAQIEFGYNADDLANKDLTAEELAEGTQIVAAYADKQTVDGDATSYYGTSYILETQISMAMAVRADRIGADCYALVSYIDHTGTEKSNIRVEGKKNYSVYEFFLNEIVVADGRCLLTIEFYKADGTKVLTVQDSMESYTARNAETYPLAEKMLAFSDSAYKYLHRNDK